MKRQSLPDPSKPVGKARPTPPRVIRERSHSPQSEKYVPPRRRKSSR